MRLKKGERIEYLIHRGFEEEIIAEEVDGLENQPFKIDGLNLVIFLREGVKYLDVAEQIAKKTMKKPVKGTYVNVVLLRRESREVYLCFAIQKNFLFESEGKELLAETAKEFFRQVEFTERKRLKIRRIRE